MVESVIRHLVCYSATIETIEFWALSVFIQDGQLANLRVSQVKVIAANMNSTNVSNDLVEALVSRTYSFLK